MASQSYLYCSRGTAHLTGIQHIESNPPPIIASLSVPEGNYNVTVNMLDWDTKPGAKDADGKPTGAALPDFLILLNPITGSATDFRKSVETFDGPNANTATDVQR